MIDHLGWPKAVFAGASRGGAYAVLCASRFADRAAAVIMIDYRPRIGIGHPGAPLVTIQTIGRKARVFATMRDALAATSRHQDAPEGSPAWERVSSFVDAVEGGFIIARRDPDATNPVAP